MDAQERIGCDRSTALGRLLADRALLQPLAADLRKSTVTLAWPANELVRREAYVALPVADVEAALDEARADADAVTLPGGACERAWVQFSDGLHSVDSMTVTRGGREITLYRTRGKDPKYSHLVPGTWYGSESRTDLQGERWSRSLPRMVVNDFGDLVPLTGDWA